MVWKKLVDWKEMDKENKGRRGLSGERDTLTREEFKAKIAYHL